MKQKHVRIFSVLITVIMLVGVLSLTALADNGPVIIEDIDDLTAAIKEQADGQTWIIKSGTYDLPRDNVTEVQGQTGWYMAITADNITIKGEGMPVLTSTTESANGAWASQNLITIFGDDVTLDGFVIKSKVEANKAIEVLGQDSTLQNLEIRYNEANEEKFSGSVYYNGDIGDAELKNVIIEKAWLSTGSVTTGKIDMENVAVDFSDCHYAGQDGFNPVSANLSSFVDDGSGLTIVVDDEIASLQSLVNNMPAGATVKLAEDVEIDAMLDINKDDITLDLNGHSITASETFTFTYDNDSHLVDVEGDGVTIKNGELVATDKNKHVLNLYGAENVTLKDVTLDHTDGKPGAPLVVNGSTVTVSGKLTTVTGSKSWYAINVGDNIDDNSAASLTFAENAQVAFEGAKSLGISVDAKKYAPATIAFRENVKVSSPDNFVVIYNPDGNNVIEDPENAGLVQNGGSYTENVTAENGIASINGKYYKTVEGAISAAKDGDTIQFASGEITLPDNLVITKRVSLVGAGKAETTLVGNIVYQFSSDQKNNTLKVSDLTLAAADSSLQGIQFRGNNANDGYNLNIVVENCAFDGWTYALAMNSHANKYHMTVKNCDFSNSLCAVNFNYDTTTSGQIADNSLKFEGQNVIAANGMAVETYGNSAAPGLAWYDTVANFEDNKPISGTVKFVHTSDEFINAVNGASSETVIVLAPGNYEMSQLTFTNKNNITLQGAGMGKTILKDTDNGYLVNLSAGDCSNLKFKDMTLQASGTTSALVKVADGTNCSGLSFENVEFTGATHGIYIGNDNSSQTSADNIQVNDCVFTDMTYAGIYAQRGNIAVDGTVFKDINSANGTAAGILFDTDYFGNNAYSLRVTDSEFSNITGTTSDSKATGAISITGDGSVNPLVVTGNTFTGNTYDLHIGKTDAIPDIQNWEISGNGAIKVFIPDHDAEYYVATFVSDKTIIDTVMADSNGKVLMPKISKKGYTFLGWKSSADREVYKAEATVKIDEDTTFTAQWMSNWEIVDDIAGAAGSGKEFFTDVKGSAWYYDAVKFVYDNGFMDGVGDNKFNPNGTLTRAMIAQVLYNLEGETSSYPTVFDDVAKSAWYADAVNWAAASGIVEGKGNNKFDPNAAITRQEMAAILYRYSELKGYDVSDVDSLAAFTDADKVASWAKEPMGWAVENYVINGKGNGKLDPTGTATRAEVAQILMNLCNNVL